MRYRDKFRPFAVSRLVAGSLFPALMLAIALAAAVVSPPAAAAAALSASSGVHRPAVLGEASLPPGAVPRAPERAAQCFDRHHPCGPEAIAAMQAEPLFLVLAQRASFVLPRAVVPVAVPDVAPHGAASLSILFRNFRK